MVAFYNGGKRMTEGGSIPAGRLKMKNSMWLGIYVAGTAWIGATLVGSGPNAATADRRDGAGEAAAATAPEVAPRAQLVAASLTRARMPGADFRGANLIAASLAQANLVDAHFQNANL